jgi:hypothetical protein
VTGLLPQGPTAQTATTVAAIPAAAAAPLGPAGAGVLEERLLLQTDLHGCLVKVPRCREARHVGCEGIVAAVTPNVICLVSPDDRLRGEGIWAPLGLDGDLIML